MVWGSLLNLKLPNKAHSCDTETPFLYFNSSIYNNIVFTKEITSGLSLMLILLLFLFFFFFFVFFFVFFFLMETFVMLHYKRLCFSINSLASSHIQ